MKKYIVSLTQDERETLTQMISTGKAAARKLLHARILLKADAGPFGVGWKDTAISEALDVGTATVERVRKRFVEEGMDDAINRRAPKREYKRKLDGKGEAHLIALSCSEPPEDRSRWTLQLLSDRMVALGHVDSLAKETVRQTLKKMNSSRG